jgi:hypothetical protein
MLASQKWRMTRMLQTVRAEVDTHGQVRLLEPLHLTQTSPAIVTLLNSENGASQPKRNALAMLEFLREHRLPASAQPTTDEIEAHVREARESWD